MKNDPGHRLAAARARAKLTQAELAEKVDAHWITISKLERGIMRLTFDWALKLSTALGVDVYEILPDDRSQRAIKVDGLIIANGRLKFKEEYQLNLSFTVDIGFAEGEDTLWFYVDTDDFYPAFQNGDLLRLRLLKEWPSNDALNRLCAIKTSGNNPEYLFGILNPSHEPEKYDLRRMSGMPMYGIAVDCAWIVTMAVYMPNAGGKPGYYYGKNVPERRE